MDHIEVFLGSFSVPILDHIGAIFDHLGTISAHLGTMYDDLEAF